MLDTVKPNNNNNNNNKHIEFHCQQQVHTYEYGTVCGQQDRINYISQMA